VLRLSVHRFLVTALLVAAATRPLALESRLNAASLQDALGIGQSRVASVRERFHRPYRINVGRGPIDFIEIVTPFRRVVMAAEEQARLGNRFFGQREAIATLAPSPSDVDIVIELTFHPLNNYVGVPSYDVQLISRRARTPAASPRTIERMPRFGPRVPGTAPPSTGPQAANPPGGSLPLVGGSVTAKVDGTRLDPRGVYDVLVLDGRTTVLEFTIDLTPLR